VAERPHTSWLAAMKTNSHSLVVEDAPELALDRPLWRLLAAGRAMHWNGSICTMLMMTVTMMNWVCCYLIY